MLVKKLQLLRVLLPDVTREQIKFTLFPDIQLTFLIYFFWSQINQPILSRVMNIFRLPPKKIKKYGTPKGNKCCVQSDENQSNPGGPAVIGLTHLHCQKVKSYTEV